MMRYILLLLLFLSSHSAITAQDKRDYIWLFGDDQDPGPDVRAFQFDFNKERFKPELRTMGFNFGQNNVSICDKEGNLLIFTNGCAIANREYEIMQNGEGINDGDFFQDAWFNGSCFLGYPGGQDVMLLPDPGYDQGYYLIHKRLDKIAEFTYDIKSLTYSYIDLALDGGLGGVTEKNVDFYTIDRFLWGYLTAIQHENGVDWWIINPGQDDSFYVFLLDENGISLHERIPIDHNFTPNNSTASGEAKISPDGTQYALFNLHDGLLLYDFDRSNGNLTNQRKIVFPEPSQIDFGICEWSSNSEFLYIGSGDSIWQVEVAYEELKDGQVFIAEYNGVKDPFSTRFNTSTLGPDCRIYIRPGSSSYSFHVIHYPNKKGKACTLVQQGIKLPEVSSTGSFPNVPRFRVDEEEKCDPSISSIFGEEVWWRRDLIAFPNPASRQVRLETDEHLKGDVYVMDMKGALLSHISNFVSGDCLDISHLPAAPYSVEFVPEDHSERIIYTEKVVKVD